MPEKRVYRTRSQVPSEISNITSNETGTINLNTIKVEPLDDNSKEASEFNQFCFENEEFKIKSEWPSIKTEHLDDDYIDEEIPDLLTANDSDITPQDVRKKTLKILEKTPNANLDVFECRFECGEKFKKWRNRYAHETLTRHFYCDICNKTCYSRINEHRKSHMSPIEQKEFDRKCDICQKSFGSKILLEKHLRTHLKPSDAFKIKSRKIYTYKHCNKTFARRGGIDAHVRNVHEESKGYKCRFCGKLFNKPAKRYYHVRTKHSVIKLKKPDPVKCEICEKSFNNKHVLEY